LAPGQEEEVFALALIQQLTFNGGLAPLQALLFDAVKWLQPLIPATDQRTKPAHVPIAAYGVTCWSKGQGAAVDFLISNEKGQRSVAKVSPPDQALLTSRRAGLVATARLRPDLARSAFADEH
jgi:hypothetical protein